MPTRPLSPEALRRVKQRLRRQASDDMLAYFGIPLHKAEADALVAAVQGQPTPTCVGRESYNVKWFELLIGSVLVWAAYNKERKEIFAIRPPGDATVQARRSEG